MCWFQIWHWFLKILSPNPQIWAFWVKKYQLYNLNEILPILYFEGADFKSDICFRKFHAQIPKFENFESKSITFLILTKFYLYNISKVLISNLTFAFCCPRLHKRIKCFRFATYFENVFFVFTKKSQNIMVSIVNFFKVLIANLKLKII